MTINLQELAHRESEKVEWKERAEDEGDQRLFHEFRTLVAFANDAANLGGGYMVYGAKENSENGSVAFTGIKPKHRLAREKLIASWALTKVRPPLFYVTECVSVAEELEVLIVIVPASAQMHQLKSNDGAWRTYTRSGSHTSEIQNGAVMALAARKNPNFSWDRQPCAAGIESLDLVVLSNELNRAGISEFVAPEVVFFKANAPLSNGNQWFKGNAALEKALDPERSLSAFMPSLTIFEPITQQIHLRNFAYLAFARAPSYLIPGAVAHMSFYPGVDKSDQASSFDLSGPLFTQIRKTLELLANELGVIFDKSRVGASNLHKYPERAIFEAVVNAFVHRDYLQPLPLRITVFANRIEILSPGGLLDSVNRAKFLRGEADAHWRNQALADLCRRLDLAQSQGQGVGTMMRSMAAAGNPPPVFEIETQSIKCILFAHPSAQLATLMIRGTQALYQNDASTTIAIAEEALRADASYSPAMELLAKARALKL